MALVSDHQQSVTELAELMEEFRLGEAQIQREGVRIAFRRRPAARMVATEAVATADVPTAVEDAFEPAPVVEAPKGIPITSPMNGIYYASPSPTSTPFVKEGETITAGQIVGLIEAMKVFNEIPSTVSGTVLKLVAETGAVVQPGDVLLYVG